MSHPRGRILLADDNADMREHIGRLLAERYDVTAVGDGQSAYTAAYEQFPDLIVADVMLPGLDGIELLHKLRTDLRTRELPVVGPFPSAVLMDQSWLRWPYSAIRQATLAPSTKSYCVLQLT